MSACHVRGCFCEDPSHVEGEARKFGDQPAFCRHETVKDHKCVACGRTVEIELPLATCAQCAGLIGNEDPVRVVLSFDSLGLYFAGWDYTTATVYHAECES